MLKFERHDETFQIWSHCLQREPCMNWRILKNKAVCVTDRTHNHGNKTEGNDMRGQSRKFDPKGFAFWMTQWKRAYLIKGARRAISLIRKYIRFHLVEVSVNVKN